MKKLLVCLSAVTFMLCASSYAKNINQQSSGNVFSVTASSTASIIDYPTNQMFALLPLSEQQYIDLFSIFATPVTKPFIPNEKSDREFLCMGDNTGWIFNLKCRKLTLDDAAGSQATITSSGSIDKAGGGAGIICPCSGPACSKQEPVPSKLI